MFEDLKNRYASHLPRYREQGGSISNDEEFIAWLVENRHMTSDDIVAIHARFPVRTLVPPAGMDITWDHDGPNPTPTLATDRLVSDKSYEKLGALDRGGMAVIHIAKDATLLRRVAYKVMDHDGGHRYEKRFLAEAQVTAQLEHPNVVPVYALERDPDSGNLAYAMKLIDGETLRVLSARAAKAQREPGPTPPDLTLDTLIEHFLRCCEAISYAHAKGVLHRDLKPGNIMVGQHHEVYVMDWGLAKLAGLPDDEPSVVLDAKVSDLKTQAGSVLGTPAYMAPEQASGQGGLGPHTDQYALGLILQELTTGTVARPRGSAAMGVSVAMQGLRNPMKLGADGLPVRPELSAIVAKATALNPEDRYTSVEAMADDVRRFRSDHEILARPDTPVQRAARSLSRHRNTTLMVILGLLLAMALLAAGAVWKSLADSHAARHREARLGAFLTDVGTVSSRIDHHFAGISASVGAAAQAASILYETGNPDNGEPFFTTADFADPLLRPAGTRYAAPYRTLMNTRYMDVSSVEPMTDEQRLRVQAMLPVRHVMYDAHIQMRHEVEAEAERLWYNEPGPIMYFVLGLQSGVLMDLPGVTWDPKGFDARERPWYREGAVATKPTWGTPIQESETGTLLVPCQMSLRDRKGELLGVLSASTSFAYLVNKTMGMLDHPMVVETFLVNDEALIMVRSSDQLVATGRDEELNEAHDTPPFPHPELKPALLEGSSGYVWTADDQSLLVHYPIVMNGWHFVVEADPKKLFD
jgi:eukaryotic-like serine/threonine-protein kinase